MSDERFVSLATDPRFRRLKHDKRKVKIDKRFKSMFKDRDFKLKYTVDKRGRPINATTNENLKRYYALSESEEENDDEVETKKKLKESSCKKEKDAKNVEAMEAESDEDNESSEDEDDSSDAGSGPDLARGEGVMSSSSDEDEDDVVREADELGVEHDWGELDKDAPTTMEATHRLAVCHMDWDHVKASDLFLLFNSFKTGSGVIRSVTVYPSDFGLQRMKEEEQRGPAELVDNSLWKKNSAAKNEEELHRELLRRYEINRLKYYYAVVDCDDSGTASNIYDQCNGREYETSGLTIDLRFVPDDMIFDNPVRDICTSVPDASMYKPRRHASTALQNSKVELSWDKTAVDRIAATSRKYTNEELDAADLDAYLASDYSDEENNDQETSLAALNGSKQNGSATSKPKTNGKKSITHDSDVVSDDEEGQIKKYRMLVEDIKRKETEKEDDKDMEMTWELGVKDKTEKLVKKKERQEDNTPWGKYLEKQREKKRNRRDEKRRKRKEAKAAASAEDDDDELNESSDGTDDSDNSLPAGVDLNDPYFAEELRATSKDFPALKKKSKSKKKKMEVDNSNVDDSNEVERKRKEKAELALLLMDGKGNVKMNDSDDEKNEKKKKKRKVRKNSRKSEETAEVPVKDPRFQDIYTNPLFNIDPSATEYKKLRKQ